jgi:hypothetical protein
LKRTLNIISSTIVIAIIIISVFIRFIGFIFDVGNQSLTYSPLNFLNYDLPTDIVFLSCFMIIMLLLRQIFLDIVFFERPRYINNKVIRLLFSLFVFYGLIYETCYFISQLKKNDTTYIIADFFCLFFTVLLMIILLKPNRQKSIIEQNVQK